MTQKNGPSNSTKVVNTPALQKSTHLFRLPMLVNTGVVWPSVPRGFGVNFTLSSRSQCVQTCLAWKVNCQRSSFGCPNPAPIRSPYAFGWAGYGGDQHRGLTICTFKKSRRSPRSCSRGWLKRFSNMRHAGKTSKCSSQNLRPIHFMTTSIRNTLDSFP